MFVACLRLQALHIPEMGVKSLKNNPKSTVSHVKIHDDRRSNSSFRSFSLATDEAFIVLGLPLRPNPSIPFPGPQ